MPGAATPSATCTPAGPRSSGPCSTASWPCWRRWPPIRPTAAARGLAGRPPGIVPPPPTAAAALAAAWPTCSRWSPSSATTRWSGRTGCSRLVDGDGLLAMARHSVSMLATTLQNPAPLTLKVISGAAPTPLAEELHAYRSQVGRPPPEGDRVYVDDKLAGNAVGNFSAFLKADWRINDWTWGRADAASRLVEALLDRLDVGPTGHRGRAARAVGRPRRGPGRRVRRRAAGRGRVGGPGGARRRLWRVVVRRLQLELWRHHLPLIESAGVAQRGRLAAGLARRAVDRRRPARTARPGADRRGDAGPAAGLRRRPAADHRHRRRGPSPHRHALGQDRVRRAAAGPDVRRSRAAARDRRPPRPRPHPPGRPAGSSRAVAAAADRARRGVRRGRATTGDRA